MSKRWLSLPKFEECTPNPSCHCGCGEEVSLPHQTFVMGHKHRRKLDSSKIEEIEEIKSRKVPQKVIAKQYGVSQSMISQLPPVILWKGLNRQPIIRKEQYLFQKRIIEAKKLVNEIKKRVKDG